MEEVKTLEELRGKLTEEFKTLREKVNERDEQIKDLGQAKESTAEEIKRIDGRIQEISTEFEEKTKDRIEAIENELQKGNRPGYGQGTQEVKSIGEIVAESEEYKAIQGKSVKSGIPGSRARMLVESFHEKPTASQKALLSSNTVANTIVQPLRVPGIISPLDQRLFVRDLIPFQATDASSVEWVEETVQAANTGATPPRPFNNLRDTAAPVPEGELKPEGHLTFELRSSTAKVIANTLTASRQILSDAGMLQAFVDNRITYSLKVEEESQLLYGDGTGENVQGVLSHAGVSERAWSDGVVGDNRVDAIRRAINDLNVLQFPATGIVMHPNEKTEIDIAKGDDGHYLWLESQFGGQSGDTRLVRLPLVETTGITAGTAAIGSWALALQGYDVWDAFVEIAEQHADYRRRNLVLVIGEERVMLANYRPQAIEVLTFDSAPV